MSQEQLSGELPVIQLHNCPGKRATRPVTEDEGVLGIHADLEYINDPANLESMTYQTLCDIDCDGPVKAPRKLLGIIPFGEEEVCPKGHMPLRANYFIE